MLKFAILFAPALTLASCDSPPPVQNAAAVDCNPTSDPAQNHHAALCPEGVVEFYESAAELHNSNFENILVEQEVK